jgi:hypothetical protein
MGRGRPPTIPAEDLVERLQRTLDWPEVAAVTTETLATKVGANQATVLNRLKTVREDETVPITGVRPGKQGGYVWWLTEAGYY